MTKHVKWGAVADDFTGATDLAGNWRSRGLRTSVLLGVPSDEDAARVEGDDAIVVALKTRSIDSEQACAEVAAATHFLRTVGVERFYDKYCSTFDSTPAGNIGPIADVMLDITGASRAVVVPSFPDNGRTVYQGHLFVGDQPLDESPMKNHPLNPMTDSDVARLLAPQTQHGVGRVPLQVVQQGPEALRVALDQQEQDGKRYIVVDAVTNDDLVVIAQATSDDRLVTGGSGLALGLQPRDGDGPAPIASLPGRRVVIAGSASSATQRQVAIGRSALPNTKIDVAAYIADPERELARLRAFVADAWAADPDAAPLIYSVGVPEDVAAARAVADDASERIEEAYAALARALSDDGVTEFLVAGGETSGSVLSALGVRLLEVGQLLSPGVSWLSGVTDQGRRHNFVLKSGNFGDEDLFLSAWEKLA